MNWRVYRLPGSRNVWHIDTGPDTVVINVAAYRAEHTNSVDIGDGWPRAWIAIERQELHIVNGIAVFTYPGTQRTAIEVLRNCNKEIVCNLVKE